MSNELTIVKDTDLTDLELEKIRDYMAAGLPGIGDINDTQLYRMLDLYMSGSTYTQISITLQVKKIIVLYLAHINKWYQSKLEGLNEIQEKIKYRIFDSKLRNQDFRLLFIQAWQKRIGKQITKFLSTNDDEHMNGIDMKEVGQLMKVMEWVDSLDEPGKGSKGKSAAVNINIGNGASIEKTGENKLSITPSDPTIGDMLAQVANAQRAVQKMKSELINKKPDIDNSTKGEKNENK